MCTHAYTHVQGDNLDSVTENEIHVAIVGETCNITAVETSSGLVCDFKESLHKLYTLYIIMSHHTCSCFVHHLLSLLMEMSEQ